MGTKTRFAPFPSGGLQLGNTRVAVFNWLAAKCSSGIGGEFILRFDDTDEDAIIAGSDEQIIEELSWLGLKWDAIYKQSERRDHYKQASDYLKGIGKIYPCYETREELESQRADQIRRGLPPRYVRMTSVDNLAKVRAPHWRFMLDDGDFCWNDQVYGDMRINRSSNSDPIIIREDGSFTYIFCSAVDDMNDGITQVIRGSDHLMNSGIQSQIILALGGDSSSILWSHLPLLVDENGAKLSKSAGAISISQLRGIGYTPMSIISFLFGLGSGESTRIFTSLDDIAQVFAFKNISRANPVCSIPQLLDMNRHCIASMPYDALPSMYKEMISEEFWLAIRESISTFVEIKDWMSICREMSEFEDDGGVCDKDVLPHVAACMPSEAWNADSWRGIISCLHDKSGIKKSKIAMTLRFLLTGKKHGPPMTDIFPHINPDIVMFRLRLSSA